MIHPGDQPLSTVSAICCAISLCKITFLVEMCVPKHVQNILLTVSHVPLCPHEEAACHSTAHATESARSQGAVQGTGRPQFCPDSKLRVAALIQDQGKLEAGDMHTGCFSFRPMPFLCLSVSPSHSLPSLSECSLHLGPSLSVCLSVCHLPLSSLSLSLTLSCSLSLTLSCSLSLSLSLSLLLLLSLLVSYSRYVFVSCFVSYSLLSQLSSGCPLSLPPVIQP